MIELFWEWHQQNQIHEADTQARSANRDARDAKHRARDLEGEIERMLLVNRALWELVRERLDLKDHHLLDKVNEIDLRDGTLDGRLRQSVPVCGKCGRSFSPRHLKCIYCGVPRQDRDPLDSTRGLVR
jgi:hypothetical protein